MGDKTTKEKFKDLTQEEFKELAKDMKNVLASMEAVLKKHGIVGLASTCMSTDGYFNFNVHDSDWEFKRANSNSKMLICKSITEEV